MCSGAEEATTKGKKRGNKSFAESTMPSHYAQATNLHGRTAMGNLNERTACTHHGDQTTELGVNLHSAQ